MLFVFFETNKCWGAGAGAAPIVVSCAGGKDIEYSVSVLVSIGMVAAHQRSIHENP